MFLNGCSILQHYCVVLYCFRANVDINESRQYSGSSQRVDHLKWPFSLRQESLHRIGGTWIPCNSLETHGDGTWQVILWVPRRDENRCSETLAEMRIYFVGLPPDCISVLWCAWSNRKWTVLIIYWYRGLDWILLSLDRFAAKFTHFILQSWVESIFIRSLSYSTSGDSRGMQTNLFW